jgi:S-adenosylmethionine:tRNA ribosyltransferase-isomerase
MKTSDFDYLLPPERVAQRPLLKRERCRLCVVDRANGEVNHRRFDDLGLLLKSGDLVVLNNSRVVQARIPCAREKSGGALEIFLLEPPGAVAQRRFSAFFKPARRAKAGLRFLPLRNPDAGAFEVVRQGGEFAGLVEWTGEFALDAAALEGLGVMPLPPYIRRERLPARDESKIDARYYQNVFAREPGSAAAPTAGLHFSQVLIASLRKKGVRFCEITLHVGAGTFLPLKSESLEAHVMHRERFHLSADSIRQVQAAKKEGRRVIAVGTTSLRVLESAFDGELQAAPGWAETDIFIKPGYAFKVVDALITNFHQPKSTLLALVSAFYERRKILDIYRSCLDLKYRFLSYGDAMLIK